MFVLGIVNQKSESFSRADKRSRVYFLTLADLSCFSGFSGRRPISFLLKLTGNSA